MLMDFSEFKTRIYQHFGLNLAGYKEPQLIRRIGSLMGLLKIPDYEAYFRLLKSDPAQWKKFVDKITINVSEFFRNPEIFARLEKEILPQLLARYHRLKIWSAACANGPEPYSLAIILAEQSPGLKHIIDATDIDDAALEEAKKGFYDRRVLQNVSAARLERYFIPEGPGYRLKNEIIRRVNFRHHDLLTDEFDRNYHLIVCRNVTIYFTPETQNKLYRQFYQSLAPGGVLFIGATENIFSYREIGFQKIGPWFYQKEE
ncbi:MAG: chemotaxis protein methyltransferase CheR [Clostridia bacterium]|nr:chemotaxis protein methyltransferase CheR [Clostridia bacterium]